MFLSLVFLVSLVFWIVKVPPQFWWQIVLFFVFVFLFFFFLFWGIWGRMKVALWLSSWVVLALFLRMKEASLFLFLLLSLFLWGIVKITP